MSIQVVSNTNAIMALLPDSQFPAPFDFTQGVPPNALRVIGSIFVINAIQNPDENCCPCTESPIRLKIKNVARTYYPQAIANAIDGIKPYFKECNFLK